MKTHQTANHPLRFAPALILSAALALGAFAGKSEAGLVIRVLDGAASVGGTGAFDIVLANTSDDPQDSFDVSGFSVRIEVASTSGITFTGVTDATASTSYIFGTQQESPFSTDIFPGIAFTASDSSWTDPYFITLASGETVGLLRVSFAVAADAAPGVVAVSLLNHDLTQINDIDGIPFDGVELEDGSITINGGAAVPEPASLVALATAAALLPIPTLVRRMRRKDG